MWKVHYRKKGEDLAFLSRLQDKHPAMGDIVMIKRIRYKVLSLEILSYNSTISVLESLSI